MKDNEYNHHNAWTSQQFKQPFLIVCFYFIIRIIIQGFLYFDVNRIFLVLNGNNSRNELSGIINHISVFTVRLLIIYHT